MLIIGVAAVESHFKLTISKGLLFASLYCMASSVVPLSVQVLFVIEKTFVVDNGTHTAGVDSKADIA